MVTVRAMTEVDLPGAVEVWDEAFSTLAAEYGLPHAPRTPEGDRRVQNRMAHFLATDPGGSFVADEAGAVVGLSQSFVREGYWVLSALAAAPQWQGQGVGRRLLGAAMANADPDGPGTIQSSRDPRAIALYASAGFSLHPAVIGHGALRSGARPARSTSRRCWRNPATASWWPVTEATRWSRRTGW
jgi:GNAT superfamily N-acetyltransferase